MEEKFCPTHPSRLRSPPPPLLFSPVIPSPSALRRDAWLRARGFSGEILQAFSTGREKKLPFSGVPESSSPPGLVAGRAAHQDSRQQAEQALSCWPDWPPFQRNSLWPVSHQRQRMYLPVFAVGGVSIYVPRRLARCDGMDGWMDGWLRQSTTPAGRRTAGLGLSSHGSQSREEATPSFLPSSWGFGSFCPFG